MKPLSVIVLGVVLIATANARPQGEFHPEHQMPPHMPRSEGQTPQLPPLDLTIPQGQLQPLPRHDDPSHKPEGDGEHKLQPRQAFGKPKDPLQQLLGANGDVLLNSAFGLGQQILGGMDELSFDDLALIALAGSLLLDDGAAPTTQTGLVPDIPLDAILALASSLPIF